MAEIVPTEAKDERTGAPIYDLIIGGPVNEPNPKAVQLHDSIKGGYVKFGTSIGAIVRKHTRDKETGGMLIDSISGKEASIVGIPKNQRSWAYKASAAVADLPDDDDLADDEPEDEREEQVVAASGEVLQQWVVTNPMTTATSGIITLPSGAGIAGPITIINTDDPATEPVPEPASTEEPVEAPAEDAPSEDPTPGGQEAEAATPETAPATEDASDPAIEQQADIEVEDVAQLVKHVAALVEEIGRLRIQNAQLTDEIEGVKVEQARLAGVEFEATETIKKVMELPLRRKAVGHVETFVNRYPQFDPRVTAYIERATHKENE